MSSWTEGLEQATSVRAARRLREEREAKPGRWSFLRKVIHNASPVVRSTSHLRDKWVGDEYQAMDLVEKMQNDISPDLSAHEAAMLKWHGMNVMDQETFRCFTAAFPNVETADIGVIPLHVLMLLWGQDPDFLKDKERVYAFLRRYKQFKVPGSRDTPLPTWQ